MKLSDFDHLRDNPMIKFKEEIVEGQSYTIIAYMIANKEMWETPLALEARGITFNTNTGECVSRPFDKFFNVDEKEESNQQQVSQSFIECFEKRDGSMVTPIITANSNILFKTKKSFYSNVANLANSMISEGVEQLSKFCLFFYQVTPIFEFTHPNCKIVINYPPEQNWTLLAIRENDSGKYFSYNALQMLAERFNVQLIPKLQMNWDEIQHSIKNEQGIEGYVLLLNDGRRVKYKTAWYFDMHYTMTDLRVRDVAESVINETVDDLKSLVVSQGNDVALIEEIESKVVNEIQLIRSQVQETAQLLQNKSFKDAALMIKDSPFFSLIMSELRGKEPNYAEFWKRNYFKTYPLHGVYNSNF